MNDITNNYVTTIKFVSDNDEDNKQYCRFKVVLCNFLWPFNDLLFSWTKRFQKTAKSYFYFKMEEK